MPFRKSSSGSQKTTPSTRSRREHQGKVPQPGIPSGPRNTPHVDVEVPYAPTPTGKALEQKAKRQRRRKRERKTNARLRAIIRDTPPTVAVERSKSGVHPDAALRKLDPKSYKVAERTAKKAIRAKEPLKDDPLAEFIIGTVATAGVGTGAKILGTAGKEGAEFLAKGGAKLVTKEADEALESGVKAVAKKAKSAPKRGAKRAKAAPRKAVARRSTKKKAAEQLARGGQRAKRKPVRYTGAGNAAVYPLGVQTPVSEKANAFATGTGKAVVENPWGTAKTTARAIPSIVTGPAALIGAAGSSIAHGDAKPLTTEATKQFQGLEDIAGTLLSGDPKKVQKATEDDVGLSLVAPFPAIGRLKGRRYEGARGEIRGKVAGKRERTRAKRRAELKEVKTGKRTKRAKKPRHAVKDSRTGEEYVLRRAGKAIEGRRQRREVSTTSAREKARGEREGLLAAKEVVKHIRKSKLPRKGDHNVGDVLSTVVQYGISRKKTRADKQLEDIRASIGERHPDEIPAQTITDLRNIEWIRKHPQLFTDKHFWRAVDAYKRQARKIETSGRKKVLAISDVYGHARPEERLEAGVKVNGKTVATNFYKDQDTLHRKQAELSELRSDAKRYREAMEKATPEERQKFAHLATEMAAQGKKLERDLKDYRAGFKQAHKDYAREAQATIRDKGYEQPAYVKDVKPRGGLTAEPGFPGGRSARKQHMASAEQARRGSVMARDFETLVNQSIAEPRMRRAMHRATTHFAEQWAQKVSGKRFLTSEEITRAINRGELDENQYAVLHSQFFKQGILDPHKTGDEFLDQVRGAGNRSLSEELANRANDKGNKYIVVPKEAVREFVHQMEPPKGIDKWVGGANRLFTRAILGYSPAWAVAQVVAEGIPAAVSIGANPARWARIAHYLAREDKRLSHEDRAAIDGTVGESAGVTPHPKTEFSPDTNVMASRFFRLSNRNRVGRALLKGATGEALSVFDRWKGGKYRKAVAAAKADRELNGFVTSLSGLMRGQRSIVEAIKGKPLAEQMAYMAKHPKEAAKLEGYLDDVMGNWRALTHHEAKFAPFVAFYPFVRYSLRWMFWSFPRQHPVKASILYFLGQQNAEELEKLAGGAPPNPLEYTFPVYTSSTGDNAVMPGGSRIAPGMNALTTAIGQGRIESTASALNPGIGALYTAVSGNDPFTGEKVADSPIEHALLGLNQLLSMPAPIRADLPEEIPFIGGDSLRDQAIDALGGDKEPSGVSKAFEELDQKRDSRSSLFPFLPQPGERYADSARLSRSLKESGYDPELGDDELMAAVKAAAKGNAGQAKRLRAKVRKSDAAGDEITRLVQEYAGKEGALPELSDKEYEWIGRITGKRVFPYEPPKKKSGNPYTEAFEETDKGNPYLEALKATKQGGNPYLKALE